YFTWIMGMLITLAYIHMYLIPFEKSSETADALGSPPQSTAGDLCLTAKGVMSTSELIRLGHSIQYVAHHLSALSHLVSHLLIKFPLRHMLLFFASQATELFSDLDLLLKHHAVTPENSSMSYAL
ncbi:hypothetical protein BJ878DRAFT_430431, partial [Calycina marina]